VHSISDLGLFIQFKMFVRLVQKQREEKPEMYAIKLKTIAT
jgi:hypothetical protein